MRVTSGHPNTKKHIGSLLFLVVLVGAVLFLLLRHCDWQDLKQQIRSADIRFLLLGAVMLLVQIVCEGESFRVITAALGSKISLWSGCTYACVDLYFSAITPSASGGQPAAAYYMGKDSVPLSRSGIALLLYTVLNKVVLLVFCALAFLLYPSLLGQGNPLFSVLLVIGVTVNVVVMTVCILSMFSGKLILRLGEKMIALGVRCRLVKRSEQMRASLESQVADFREGAGYVRHHPLMMLRVFGICFIKRLATFSIVYFVYKSFGLQGASFFYLLAIQAVLALAVDSLPLPGAMGATESVFLSLYGVVFGTQFLMPALLLTRGINYYLCLLLCAAVTMGIHLRLCGGKRKGEDCEINRVL